MQSFENCTLSPELFSHEAHLRLAWLHIQLSGVKMACSTIESQLRNYVNHVGAEDKFHLSITVAGTQLIAEFMSKSKSSDFTQFIEEFPELKTDFKALINTRYSYDIFLSEEAKRKYLEPDLLPFDVS